MQECRHITTQEQGLTERLAAVALEQLLDGELAGRSLPAPPVHLAGEHIHFPGMDPISDPAWQGLACELRTPGALLELADHVLLCFENSGTITDGPGREALEHLTSLKVPTALLAFHPGQLPALRELAAGLERPARCLEPRSTVRASQMLAGAGAIITDQRTLSRATLSAGTPTLILTAAMADGARCAEQAAAAVGCTLTRRERAAQRERLRDLAPQRQLREQIARAVLTCQPG